MAYEPPFNPQVISPGRFRRFSGVSGEPTKVIKVADSNGRDLSDSFANDQFDLNADKKGELKLREGCIKIGDGIEASIGSIFQIFLGGNLQYGFVDIDLNIYPIPYIPRPKIPLPPEDLIILPLDFPSTFPVPILPSDDAPPDDPSVPLDGQACEDHHDHSTSPETLSFIMKYAEPPSNQSWYWMIRGWWPTITHYGTYSIRPAWYQSYEVGQWSYRQKYCDAIQQVRVVVHITGKDASGNWLPPGSYSNNETLLFTDGDSHVVAIDLTIYGCIMSVETNPISLSMTTNGWIISWDDITVQNETSGATLNWSVALTTDETGGKMTLVPATGIIENVGSDDIVVSVSNPIDAGSYSNVATVSGEDAYPATIPVAVNLSVVAPSSAEFHVTSTGVTWQVAPTEEDPVSFGPTTYHIKRNSATSYSAYDAPYGLPFVLSAFNYYATDPGTLEGAWSGEGWYVSCSVTGIVYPSNKVKLYGKVTATATAEGFPIFSFAATGVLVRWGVTWDHRITGTVTTSAT